MHFFLFYPLFSNQIYILLSTINDTDSSLSNTNDSILTDTLLVSKGFLDISANALIHNATMNYVTSTNRFEESLS